MNICISIYVYMCLYTYVHVVLQCVTVMPRNMQHTLQQPAICMCTHETYTATTCIMCSSLLQCVMQCVLQCVAECVTECIVVCCIVKTCCRMLQSVAGCTRANEYFWLLLQCGAKRVAVCTAGRAAACVAGWCHLCVAVCVAGCVAGCVAVCDAESAVCCSGARARSSS